MSNETGAAFTGQGQHMICEAPLYERLVGLSERQPDAPALVSAGGEILTFQQLRQLTHVFSGALAANGLSKDARVAVIMPPGIEQAAALIAAASAAVCVPLNQNTPRQEWPFYLKATGVQAILVSSETDELVCEIANGTDLCIFSVCSLWAEEPFKSIACGIGSELHPDACRPQLDDDALVLATSGTTATPKRVVITQSNLRLDAKNTIDVLGLTSEDTLMSVLPLHHAHGLSALLAAISAGGKAICGGLFNADRFLRSLSTLRPTWVTASPTMYFELVAELARTPSPTIDHSLRFFRSMSAPLPDNLLRELESVFRIPMIEAYGMTEATSQIASNPLPPGSRKAGSVGRPAGTLVKITGADGRTLPPGQWGEVVVEGATVARGYLADGKDNRSVVPLSALLPTGDVGYVDDDGYIFLVGRTKDIINRGGEKISPIAVETVLLLHPAISEVVVFALPHPRLGEEVAAAVVLKTGLKATSGDIRAFAADSGRLLLSHIPKLVKLVDGIPKNKNGKVLRRIVAEEFGALSAHASDACASNENYAAEDDISNSLNDIWQLALNAEHVDADSNFFQLGGDSLAAEHIITGVDERFSCELTFREIFEHPTVNSLAKLIKKKMDHNGAACSSVETSGVRTDVHRPSYRQGIIFDAQSVFPQLPIFNLPFAYEFFGPLNTSLLLHSIRGIINRHPALRTQFTKGDGELTANSISPESVMIDLECEDWTAISKTRLADFISAMAQKEAWRRIDLSVAPLARFRLLRFDENHHVLLATFHHIIWDGWSMRVFLQELQLALSSREHHAISMLSGVDAVVRPYALDDDGLRSSRQEVQHLDYWQSQFASALEGQPPEPQIEPAGAVPLAGKLTFNLDADSIEAVEEFSRAHNNTVFVTLLSAYMVLLGGRFGRDKVSTALPVANRQRLESKLMLGLHANTMLVTVGTRQDQSFSSVAEAVKENILRGRESQDIPFEYMFEKFAEKSPRASQKLLNYSFTYENERDYSWRTDRLSLAQCSAVTGQGQTTLPFGHASLMLAMNRSSDRLSGSLYYREDMIRAGEAREIISDLSGIVVRCNTMAEAPLGRLLSQTRS